MPRSSHRAGGAPLRRLLQLCALAAALDVATGAAKEPVRPLNDNAHLSQTGMVETIVINFFVFVVLMLIFESNRFYKQIYLKRLQNRFRVTDRVPPNPPEYSFGWFFEMQKISETELLRMVGLDAYMCLRFIVVSYKFALFVTFWGLLVLVPVYGSSSDYDDWDAYAISNLMRGERPMRTRLWISAIFGYVFAAYFCQLLYLEYNNFSVRRLQYLVQADPDSDTLDPDTPPQKYFTVMIEHIPSHLRSAEALYKFFDKIFPGEVYTVEIALDIAELNAMNDKRKRLRAKLESAIAHWEAKNERLLVYARNRAFIYNDDEDGIFGADDLWGFILKQCSREKMGYEKVDAINYYSEKLMRYNREVNALQDKYNASAANADEGLQRKFKNRSDTRVAAFVENIGSVVAHVKGDNSPNTFGVASTSEKSVAAKSGKGFAIESLLFGGGGTKITLDAAFDRETQRLEQIVAQEAQDAQRRLSRTAHEAEGARKRSMTHHATVLNTDLSKNASTLSGKVATQHHDEDESDVQIQAMQAKPFEGTTHFAQDEDAAAVADVDGDLNKRGHEESTVTSMLEQDHTLKEWMSKSGVDFQKEEYIVSRKTMRDYSAHSSHSNTSQHGVVSYAPFGADNASRRPSARPLHAPSRSSSLTHGPGHVHHHSQSRGASRGPSRDSSAHGGAAALPSVLVSKLAGLFSTASSDASHSYNIIPEENDEEVGLANKVISMDERELNASREEDLMRARRALLDTDDAALEPSWEGGKYHTRSEYAPRDVESVSSPMHDVLPHIIDPAHMPAGHARPQPRPSVAMVTEENRIHARTDTGGVAMVLPVNALTSEQLNELTLLSIEKARLATKQGWLQTKLAGSGALRGIVEIERAIEMVMLGAYYKYSSTAFVTFTSRVTESIAQQMLLSHDTMDINHAPNPHDIIWDNVAIPKSQILMRNYITNVGVVIGSIFWSSLVNDVNAFSTFFPLPLSQQQLMSAVVMLIFLVLLPFIFDYLARHYEGLKLESEIQNSIMTRYFYYQLINVYVTVGFSSSNLWEQILQVLSKPQTLVDIIGGRMPDMSKFFFNLLIVKIFTALPLEMIRPWQLSTIHLMGNCMDRRKCTRRDLRSGAFFSWPMLYGWIYPQLMMVLMIMCVYAVITPLLMPVCAVFFAGAYVMYKYQLLYVYINDYQSGGYMWYAVFGRSVVALGFASGALLGYLSLQLKDPGMSGPFFFLLPLPFCLFYFNKYCENKFRKASMNLSYGFARELDHRNAERRVAGKTTPHNTFSKACYRQPSLTEGDVLPEPYRVGNYDILQSRDTGEKVVMADWDRRNRKGSISLNVHELVDEGEEDPIVLQDYFESVVLPLAVIPDDRDGSEHSLEEVVTRERR